MDVKFRFRSARELHLWLLILNLESTFKCSLSICLVFKDQPDARPARPALAGCRVSHAPGSPSWRAVKMIRPGWEGRKGVLLKKLKVVKKARQARLIFFKDSSSPSVI